MILDRLIATHSRGVDHYREWVLAWNRLDRARELVALTRVAGEDRRLRAKIGQLGAQVRCTRSFVATTTEQQQMLRAVAREPTRHMGSEARQCRQ